jgi:micrococcal nuclease
VKQILLVALVAACSTSTAPGSDAPVPGGGGAAAVERVLDGDSLAVIIEGRPEEVRLLGINAPERGDCYAEEAKSELETAVADGVELLANQRDRFDRLLGYVFSGQVNINQQIVARGAALALAVEHDLLPDFLAAEQEAVDRGAGLWAACASEAAGSVEIVAVEFDPPGRDESNRNSELVAIASAGADVDMTGWILRDESSSHRYEFPGGFVLRQGALVVVRSGCGDDTKESLYWCAPHPVWNNTGDTALVLDADGRLVARSRYLSN